MKQNNKKFNNALHKFVGVLDKYEKSRHSFCNCVTLSLSPAVQISVSIKYGEQTADCGPRTGHKTRTEYKMQTEFKNCCTDPQISKNATLIFSFLQRF